MKCDLKKCETGNVSPFIFFFSLKKIIKKTSQITSLIMFGFFPHLWLERGHRFLRIKKGSWNEGGIWMCSPLPANTLCVGWGYECQGCKRMSPQKDVTPEKCHLAARVSADPWRKHRSKGDVSVK